MLSCFCCCWPGVLVHLKELVQPICTLLLWHFEICSSFMDVSKTDILFIYYFIHSLFYLFYYIISFPFYLFSFFYLSRFLLYWLYVHSSSMNVCLSLFLIKLFPSQLQGRCPAWGRLVILYSTPRWATFIHVGYVLTPPGLEPRVTTRVLHHVSSTIKTRQCRTLPPSPASMDVLLATKHIPSVTFCARIRQKGWSANCKMWRLIVPKFS